MKKKVEIKYLNVLPDKRQQQVKRIEGVGKIVIISFHCFHSNLNVKYNFRVLLAYLWDYEILMFSFRLLISFVVSSFN